MVKELKKLNKTNSKFEDHIERLAENNEDIMKRVAKEILQEMNSDDRINIKAYSKIIDLLTELTKTNYKIFTEARRGVSSGFAPRIKGDSGIFGGA